MNIGLEVIDNLESCSAAGSKDPESRKSLKGNVTFKERLYFRDWVAETEWVFSYQQQYPIRLENPMVFPNSLLRILAVVDC